MIEISDIIIGCREASRGKSGHGAFAELLSKTGITEGELVQWCASESAEITVAAMRRLRELGIPSMNTEQAEALHSSLAVALETGVVSTIHAYEHLAG